MKKTALWLLVVVASGCSGPKGNSGPPFLEGLAVNGGTPLVLKCQGHPISADYTFSNKDEFRAEYSALKDGMANGKEYAPGNGSVYTFQFFNAQNQTDISFAIHDGNSLCRPRRKRQSFRVPGEVILREVSNPSLVPKI
jgi:hypothetical protein